MPEAGNAGVRCPQAAPGSAGCRVRRKLGGGAMEMSALPNIVLVHGAWAHGSSWSAVIERLQADGYQVTAPQFPLTSLADNVARLRQALARQNGPTVLAGHSFGAQIITPLGTDAPYFVDHYAADFDPVKARVMHAVQQPLAASALQEVISDPAWNRSRPDPWSPT